MFISNMLPPVSLMIVTNLKKILLYGPRDKISIFSMPALFYYSRFSAIFSIFHERKHPTSPIITGSVQVQQKNSH